MPAKGTNYLRLFPVQDSDVVSEVMKQRGVMPTIQHELPAREHPFEYVPERFRLAVARLFFFVHAFLLAQKESPTGTITGRAR
jgi:hypothetical protein